MDPVLSDRVPSVPKVRMLFAAAGVQAGLTAVALLLARDGETVGRVAGAVLLSVGAAGSLFCAVVCSMAAFRVSLIGLVVGYAERALALPWAILSGLLDVDPWRAIVAVAVYSSMAVLIGLVWLRLLLPVLVVTCEWTHGGEA